MLLVVLAGCKNSGSPDACAPGEQIGCACENGENGAQRCAEDGSGYGECACESSTTTSTSSGGAAGAGGTGGAGGETTSSAGAGGSIPDADGDSYAVEEGDCDDTDPEINPAAVDFLDGIDNDCDGKEDNVLVCDGELAVNSTDGVDAMRAIGVCNPAWIVSAEYRRADGSAPPGPPEWPALINDYFHWGHGILPGLGDYYVPREGARMLVLSTGVARPPSDPNWTPHFSRSYHSDQPTGGMICGGTVATGKCYDSIELTTTIAVPPNAHGFSFNHAHLSFLLPMTCTPFDDVFRTMVNALDSVRCSNGGEAFTPSCGAFFTAPSSALVGTGFENHGGTPWLRTSVPADPGTTVKLAFAVWDSQSGEADLESVIDHFQWSTDTIVSVSTVVQP